MLTPEHAQKRHLISWTQLAHCLYKLSALVGLTEATLTQATDVELQLVIPRTLLR